MPANPNETTLEESSVNFQTFLSLLLAMSVGLLLAVLLLPRWMPNLGFSLSGDAPRAFWYLARGSALRFLLTRLVDFLNVPAGALVKPKDPLEYVRKLRFHQSVASVRDYGLMPSGCVA